MELKDKLTGALIGIARATDGSEHLITDSSTAMLVEGLAASASNCDEPQLTELITRAEAEKRKMVPDCFLCVCPCGRTSDFDLKELGKLPEPVRAMKIRLLEGVRTLALRNARGDAVDRFYYKALIVIGMEDFGEDRLAGILQELNSLY